MIGGDLAELDAHAERRLRVNDSGRGVEGALSVGDGNSDGGSDGEGIHHIEIAAVRTEIAGARAETDIIIDFEDFGGSDKGKTQR